MVGSRLARYSEERGNVQRRGVEQMLLDKQLRHEGVLLRYDQAAP